MFLLDGFQFLSGFLHLGFTQGHACQFHLQHHLNTGQHQVCVQFLLLVLDHDGGVLVLDEPGTQTVHQVVLQQFFQGNLADVLDVFLCPVTGVFVCQWFQSQYIACRAVSGQVGNDLAVLEAARHHFQASEQSLCVEQVLHPQDVDDDLQVIAGVMPGDFTLVGQEEVK